MALLNFWSLFWKLLLVFQFLIVASEAPVPEGPQAPEEPFAQIALLNVTGIIRRSTTQNKGDNPDQLHFVNEISPLNQLDILNGQTSMILLDKSTSEAILKALGSKQNEAPNHHCPTEISHRSWNDGHHLKLRRTKGGHGTEMENNVHWLTRLFGFDHRPPSVFFREYHVHILWDVIFQIVRWLFFYSLSFVFAEEEEHSHSL